MIVGIGCDIVQTSRILEILEKHGESFFKKILTDSEITTATERPDKNQYLASRWAVKEAVSKMLGTGIGAECNWKDVEVFNDTQNKPKVLLTGVALKTSQMKGIQNIFVSISHEKENAIAFVVGERYK